MREKKRKKERGKIMSSNILILLCDEKKKRKLKSEVNNRSANISLKFISKIKQITKT